MQDSQTPDIVRNWIAQAPTWLEQLSLTRATDISLGFLDQGEREAIALAEELHAERLIVDETLARKEAIRRKLSVIGTLGVLRNAARAKLLSLPEALSRLQDTSFYVASELIQALLDEDARRPV